MAVPYFHLQQRTAWVRSSTHTVVQDAEPDYARFAGRADGTIQRVLRIWLAEPGPDRPFLRAYLGSVTVCQGGPSLRDLRRVFRRAAAASNGGGRHTKRLWPELAALLRRFLGEHRAA